MSKPFKMSNFGVGAGLSPYKESDEDKDKKPKVNVKEQGGDQKGKDKGWVKGLKAVTTIASHALASVYGGTAHTPKINWGKKKEAVEDKPSGEDLVEETLKKDTPPLTSFENAEDGNAFRAWVNKNHPEDAKKMDLDATGSHNNSYIKNALTKYGEEYSSAAKYSSNSAVKMLSPVKARQSSRGGKRAGKATATGKRRGGFAKSGGKRGGGGRNVGGYNVQTRFKPRAAQPIKGGVTSGGGGNPVSHGKNGDMIFSPTINNYLSGGSNADASADATATATTTGDGREWVPPEYGTENGKLPTYRESWDKNNKNVQSNYKTYEDYEVAAKKWNAEHGTKSTSRRVKTKDGYWKTIPGGGPTTTSTANANANANSGVKFKGKFTYGGYRTMHGK
tara:strand:- start:2370 stop:3545 length:1176 start_codon:yes stop_codon:yes gene_type:complete